MNMNAPKFDIGRASESGVADRRRVRSVLFACRKLELTVRWLGYAAVSDSSGGLLVNTNTISSASVNCLERESIGRDG